MNILKIPSTIFMIIGLVMVSYGANVDVKSDISVFTRIAGWVIFCIFSGIGYMKLIAIRKKHVGEDIVNKVVAGRKGGHFKKVIIMASIMYLAYSLIE